MDVSDLHHLGRIWLASEDAYIDQIANLRQRHLNVTCATPGYTPWYAGTTA